MIIFTHNRPKHVRGKSVNNQPDVTNLEMNIIKLALKLNQPLETRYELF